MLPPGRLRLLTRPPLIGSPPIEKTIGMVVVAAFAASADGSPPTAAITATWRRTRSEASEGDHNGLPASDIRSPHSALRRSRLPLNLLGMQLRGRQSRQASWCQEIRPRASRAAAHARPAAL